MCTNGWRIIGTEIIGARRMTVRPGLIQGRKILRESLGAVPGTTPRGAAASRTAAPATRRPAATISVSGWCCPPVQLSTREYGAIRLHLQGRSGSPPGRMQPDRDRVFNIFWGEASIFLNKPKMQIKFFAVPVVDGEKLAEELNAFLRSKKILQVERMMVNNAQGAYWCFSIQYVEDVATGDREKTKIDYMKVLDEATFTANF